MRAKFLATAASALIVQSTAFAQEVADQASPVGNTPETIVITGSFIRGTPEDAALPVDVFNSEELEQSGVSSPLEFIKDLPSVGSVLGDTNQFSASAQGNQGQNADNRDCYAKNHSLLMLRYG